ncbi:MAG: hypothetical protein NTY33_01090 [Candidatus Moranbacteria bacterium]|nr:hypothetical protein [Candidatus Moranbacteria bacterium]
MIKRDNEFGADGFNTVGQLWTHVKELYPGLFDNAHMVGIIKKGIFNLQDSEELLLSEKDRVVFY